MSSWSAPRCRTCSGRTGTERHEVSTPNRSPVSRAGPLISVTKTPPTPFCPLSLAPNTVPCHRFHAPWKPMATQSDLGVGCE